MSDWMVFGAGYLLGGFTGLLLMALMCVAGQQSRREEEHDQP
ncbi:MAG: hypothetical protein N2318_01060 [Meiothermus sp.]|nr:hypothetical protein [Meiothermus sp.]